jgi:hypothetical protein
VIEATESGDRQLIRVTAGKLLPDNFRLLQQYRHKADIRRRCLFVRFWGKADISFELENVGIQFLSLRQRLICSARMPG